MAHLSRVGRSRSSFGLLACLAVSLSTLTSVAFAPRKAHAQGAGASKDAKEKARVLFKEGAKAIEQGKHAEGLPLLEQAETLFHAPTHLLYIARAKASLGRLVDARETYQKLSDEALPPKASDAFREAQKDAKKELTELDRRLPKLRVDVEPAGAPGLSVTMNGQPLASERFGAAFNVDPGTFSFEARANDLEAGKVTVDAAERTTTEVRLVLHAIGQKGPAESGSRVVPQAESGWSGMKIASLPLMGIGGAALAAGGALGALHFVRQSEADDKFAECGASCRADVESLDNDAALFGNLAIGLLAGGAAALGTGIILFALAPSAPSDEAPPAVSVSLSPGYITVETHF